MEKLYRLLYPMRVVLVTVKSKNKKNIMPAAWCFPLSMNPPIFGVSVSKGRYTYQMIKEEQRFAINIPTPEMKGEIIKCGSVSGRDVDKFSDTGLTEEEGKLGLPLIKECSASIECQLEREIEIGDHVLFVGRAKNVIKRKESKGIYQLKGKEFISV